MYFFQIKKLRQTGEIKAYGMACLLIYLIPLPLNPVVITFNFFNKGNPADYICESTPIIIFLGCIHEIYSVGGNW